MRILNASRSSIHMKTILVGFTAALVLGTALVIGSVASAKPTDASGPCTINAQMLRLNIQIDNTVPPGRMVAAAHKNLKSAHPHARVVEEKVGRAHSGQIPSVDGQNVVVLRVEGEEDMPIGAPVDFSGGATKHLMGQVSCAVAFYDSNTGEFIVEVQSLTPRK
jgi:hypothetical protein